MKTIKIIVLSVASLVAITIASGFTQCKSSNENTKITCVKQSEQKEQVQTVNMFVTHGHCSTPFAGIVDNFKVFAPEREDQGNPLENMEMSFEIDPNSFNACRGDDLTKRVKTPGLFIGENDEKMIFKSTNVFTMGVDWYQINGVLSIKGVKNEVKFFATGIRKPNDIKTSSMVLEGQLNLLDWGIDYDKIVNGKSDSVPTKWLHLNMKFGMC